MIWYAEETNTFREQLAPEVVTAKTDLSCGTCAEECVASETFLEPSCIITAPEVPSTEGFRLDVLSLSFGPLSPFPLTCERLCVFFIHMSLHFSIAIRFFSLVHVEVSATRSTWPDDNVASLSNSVAASGSEPASQPRVDAAPRCAGVLLHLRGPQDGAVLRRAAQAQRARHGERAVANGAPNGAPAHWPKALSPREAIPPRRFLGWCKVAVWA